MYTRGEQGMEAIDGALNQMVGWEMFGAEGLNKGNGSVGGISAPGRQEGRYRARETPSPIVVDPPARGRTRSRALPPPPSNRRNRTTDDSVGRSTWRDFIRDRIWHEVS